MGRRSWGPAAVALLGLLVSGCSDPEPRFAEPTESASPSASASPSVSESSEAEPEALDREETVRAWVEARNAALQDGDTSAATKFYATPCEGCSEIVDPIADVYGKGGYFETPGWRVRKVVMASPTVLDMRVNISAGTTQASAAEDPKEFPAETRDFRFGLTKQTSGAWRISSIAVFEQ